MTNNLMDKEQRSLRGSQKPDRMKDSDLELVRVMTELWNTSNDKVIFVNGK